MNYLEALLLAVVQGLTEFLPVSSSGHLVLVHHWFGTTHELDFFFGVLVHVGTLFAILVFFRRDVGSLVLGAFGRPNRHQSVFTGWERQALGYLMLSFVPTMVIGLGIETFLLEFLTKPSVVGIMLLCTGSILWSVRHVGRRASRTSLTIWDVLFLGLVQGIAVIPGISRSGITIVAGLFLGVNRDLAVRFSLLMSVPAILGATVLEWIKRAPTTTSILGLYLAGLLIAGLIGYAAIACIVRLVQRDRLHLFAYYLWPLGLLALVLG